MQVPSGLLRPALAGIVPYEPGKPIEEVQRELGLERVVKLASNEGPYGPFPRALEALERAEAELNRYPDGGAYRLRTALANLHAVAFEEVAVGSGADGVIDALSQAVVEPGNETLRPLRIEVRQDHPIEEGPPLRDCGYEPTRIVTGGGSDANALQAAGFDCVNLANGTERNHESAERVRPV